VILMKITADFIKFVAEVIILIMLLSVVFGEEGIASNTYNYMTFAEPKMLQDYISSAFTAGGQAVGDFSVNVKTTGQPHKIDVYYENGIAYVHVTPAIKTYLKTTYAAIDPEPIATDCYVKEKSLQLPDKLIITITVKKTFEAGRCILDVTI
jgi:hypothetical protein